MKRWFFFLFAIIIAGATFAQSTAVEFQINMSVKILKGQFDPATEQVKIAGNFNGWNNGLNVLDDSDGDSIYTAVIDTFATSDTLFFKFIKGADGWESDPNREYVVPGENSVYTAYFDRDSVYSNTKTISVTFSCNMEFEKVSGRFNPATDTLSARGDFNGWSGSTDLLEQSVGDPNYYEITRDYVASQGETIHYKYAYIGPNGTNWEGDPNKEYTFTDDDYNNGTAFAERTYNDATLATLTNNPVAIKFTVDVTGAISSVTGTAFPSYDNVVVGGAVSPLTWPTGGWPNSDSAVVIYLNDSGMDGDVTAGDAIWSKDITFPKYSVLRVQYKYGLNWALPSNTGGNDNESSVGTDHFINMTSEMASATVENQWSVMGDKDLVDVVLTGIRDLPNLKPSTYSLSQNYPNPFNPSTKIQFGIPESGLVTLKVYDLLGQEVATLVNEQKNAGSYEVDFDATNLNTGVYFYKITSGNYSVSKKMILLK
ncbi:MAG: T9SS type A sorting domain-containing protein [Ignavibacteriaceae bacterium]